MLPGKHKNHSLLRAPSVHSWLLTICMHAFCVFVYVYIYVYVLYTYIPPSWPENNLPKQVTRQGFHLENNYRNNLILQISFQVAAIFLNASTLTTEKEITSNHKNARKQKREKENQKT